MKFTIVDIEGIYRRMLAETNPAVQKQIFLNEIVAPYEGLFNIFGGDKMGLSKQWTLFTPDALQNGSGEKLANMLDKMAAADVFKEAEAALQTGYQAFAPYHDRIPTPEIVFGLFPTNPPAGSPFDPGYAGFGAIAGWIMVTVSQTTDDILPRLKGATVHELHHNLAGAAGQPMNNDRNMNEVTVAEYIIGEGLAESFAGELYGSAIVGPWVTGLQGETLAKARRMIGESLNVSGFNEVRRYIFGDRVMSAGTQTDGIPDYAGYAIGYHVVQAYMRRTGKNVVETTFVPPQEIIAESGYFD